MAVGARLNVAVNTQSVPRNAAHLRELVAAAERLERATGTMATRFSRDMDRMTDATRRLRHGGETLHGSFNRFSRSDIITNVGYQIQDMAVQAQMGTSAFVIMAQQLPQLAMGFGPLVSVMAGFLAITLAIGGALWKFKGATDGVADSQKKFDAVLKSAKAAMDAQSASAENLTEKYGALGIVVGEILGRNTEMAIRNTTAAIMAMAGEFDDLLDKGQLFDQTMSVAAAEMSAKFQLGSETQARALEASMEAFRKSANPEEVVQGYRRILGVIDGIAAASGGLSPPMQQFRDAVAVSMDRAAELTGQVQNLSGVTSEAEARANSLAKQWERAAAGLRTFNQAENRPYTEQQNESSEDMAAGRREWDRLIEQGVTEVRRLKQSWGEYAHVREQAERDALAAIQDSLESASAMVYTTRDLVGETERAAAAASSLAKQWERAASGMRAFNQAENQPYAQQQNESSEKVAENRRGFDEKVREAERQRRILVQTYNQYAQSQRIGEQDAITALGERKVQVFADNMNKIIDENEKAWEKAQRGGGGGGNDRAKDLEREREKREQVIQGLLFEIDMVGQSEVAQRAANEARRAGVDINSSYGNTISALVFQLEGLQRQQELVEEQTRWASESLADMFSGILTGASSGKEMVASLAEELGRLALTRGFTNLLGAGGFGGGAIGGFLGDTFGIGLEGHRANGGHMRAGRAYEVGERGREIVVPGADSQVIPNHQLGGGAVILQYSPKIDARGADMGAVARMDAANRKMASDMQKGFADRVNKTLSDGRYKGALA